MAGPDAEVRPGNSLPLKNIPTGLPIHNIELKPNGGGQLVRSAGASAGFGAGSAAPIARRVLDYWLLGLYPSEQDLALVRYGKASAPVGTPRLASQVPLVTDQKTLVLSDAGVLSERDIPPIPSAIASLPDARLETAAQEEDEGEGNAPAAHAGNAAATATPAPALTPAAHAKAMQQLAVQPRRN